jgi:hypothetical protein
VYVVLLEPGSEEEKAGVGWNEVGAIRARLACNALSIRQGSSFACTPLNKRLCG